MAKTQSTNSPSSISQAAEAGKKRKSFFSFGDEGVTATVGANGSLLRISRHFPEKRTGLCVDYPEMPEPWAVTSRLNTFLDWAEDLENGKGIGPPIGGSPTETIVNDRWPTFDGALEDGTQFKLQYVAHGGTIYQKFEFIEYNTTQDHDSLADDYSVPGILVTPDLLIRDLDFFDAHNKFNEARADDDSYKSRHRGNCLIRDHVNGKKKGVFSIHVLDEHESLQFVKPERRGDVSDSGESANFLGEVVHFMVQRKSATTWSESHDDSESESLCFILAYTLEYVSENKTSIVALPPWKQVCQTMNRLLQPYEKHSLSNNSNSTLDFFLGRNLEYILSVCSIPVSDTSKKELPCFALTCGDVDGHRVAVAASFNAFQFLLAALEHFQHQHENLKHCDCRESLSGATRRSYICTMKQRIERVCGGHVKWLLEKADRSGGRFMPNYWANGEEIHGWEDNPYLPKQTLVNAPFQIIKACTFIDMAGKSKFPLSTNKLKGIIEAWVKDLDGINRLGLDAFPRYDDEPTRSFYLTDHALIWQAVKSAEKLNLTPQSKGLGSTSYSSPSHLKRNILKRFTTENPQSKKRMIAVTRSPVQTRFLLRSRDTALFGAMELGFFDKPEEGSGGWPHTIELWKSTIDCQKDHEDNDELSWNDPRRFALSLIMAQINKPMNSRPAKEMFEHAMSVLLRCSSNNGLFPGRLNERNEPALFEDEERRDNYWEVAFEIPYILWKHGLGPFKPGGSDEKPGGQSSPESGSQLVLAELQSISQSSTETSNLLREAQGRLTGSRRAKAPLDYSMKTVHPFNNMVDEQNIVELQDEWLYNEPVFFIRKGTMSVDSAGQRKGSNWGKDDAPGSVVQASSPCTGFMIDVSKSRPLEKAKKDSVNNNWHYFSTKGRVSALMGNERDREKAKKRLWVFLSGTPAANEACLSTVFTEEKKELEMQGFYDRHKFYVRSFTEETSAVLNTWTTEIHLSFYRVADAALDQDRKTQKSVAGQASSLSGARKDGRRKPLVKVAMSFRFEGDLFDRYWTCRFLEADQNEMDQRKKADTQHTQSNADWLLQLRLNYEMGTFLGNGHENSLGKNSWQQRRVLELMLFGRMLQRMTLGADEVLAEAWLSLCDRNQTTDHDSRLNSTIPEDPEYDIFLPPMYDFVISRKRVEQVQRVLRAVIGNLDGNFAQITLWQDREKDRLAERPRWTFHDEHRFRVIIQKLIVSNDHDMRKLTRVHLKMSKLEESLVKKLEIMRSDLEEKRGGETQLFTYVTVVFLPLGFATGIFSMSEAPVTQTLTNMIYTALGAFAAVAVMVILVKVLQSLKVTNWKSQVRLKWKEQLRQRGRVESRRVQDGNNVPDHARTTSSRRIWSWRGIRRPKSHQDDAGKDIAKSDGEAV